MEFAVIGDEDAATGFRLAGIKRTYSADQAPALLRELLKDETIGVLIMTEKFAEENRALIEEHRISNRIVPIVVEVPGISGPLERKRDPVQELIKRAIGTDITEQ